MDTARSVARIRPEISSAAEQIAGGWAVFTGVGSPISEARGLGMDGPVTADDMDRLESFYHSRGDAIRIEVCPLSDPTLHQLLATRGYRLLEFSNMLARPLGDGQSMESPAANGRITTRIAASSEGPIWAETVARCFAGQMPITQELIDVVSCWTQSTIGACYFAHLDGEIAGGGSVAMNAAVALLGGAGTVERFRNRGVQQALIAARLAHAVRTGCDLAMTVTLPGCGSQRNCERYGFQVAYTRAKFILE